MDLTRLNTSSGIVAVPLPFTLSPSEDPAAATRSAVETGFSCAVETRATGALPWCNFVTEEVCMWKHDAGRTMPGEKRPKEMTLRVVKRMTVFQRRPSAALYCYIKSVLKWRMSLLKEFGVGGRCR